MTDTRDILKFRYGAVCGLEYQATWGQWYPVSEGQMMRMTPKQLRMMADAIETLIKGDSND